MATLQIRYPMLQQIDTVLLWRNEGAQALDPYPDPGYSRRRNTPRDRSLRRLRGLIERLGFTDETARSLAESTRLGGRHIGALPLSLLDTLEGSLRKYGYIYPAQADQTVPVWDITPLTGQQLHIIRLLADGWSTMDIADSILANRDNVNACLRRAQEQTASSSRSQLVATVFRHNWMPSLQEERSLKSVTVSPCLGYAWVPVKQKGTGNA